MTSAFELLQDRNIEEMNTRARLYRHIGTGAEVLSLSNDDENKVFAATFRSPPNNSTGVAHILEHSVLCGSRKYPVKEPFVELMKGSLKTFLNAFTYPDKTCYPVASQNLKDFYNLVDVYLDAVFYPRIDPFIFQQEGWHLELDNIEKPLAYKGVVFNEMKGAYSSPDNVLSERTQQSLFPDITYGLDSGGDPGEIPSLTFQEFKEFHTRYYHPSNARFFFYGDDDPELRLRIIHEYLKDFDRQAVDSFVPLQPAFSSPKRLVRTFASGGSIRRSLRYRQRDDHRQLAPSRNDRPRDEPRPTGVAVHPHRHAGFPAAQGTDRLRPRRGTRGRRARKRTAPDVLLHGDSRESTPRTPTGSSRSFWRHLAHSPRTASTPKTVEAAVNTIEFRLRENNTGSYPRVLVLMLRALTTWLYDSDPPVPPRLRVASRRAQIQAGFRSVPVTGVDPAVLYREYSSNHGRPRTRSRPCRTNGGE